MGEEDTATALNKQKRRAWRQIALATLIALGSAYAIPYWISEGPAVFVVVAVVVIAGQVFSVTVSASQLWKLRAGASAEATEVDDRHQ